MPTLRKLLLTNKYIVPDVSYYPTFIYYNILVLLVITHMLHKIIYILLPLTYLPNRKTPARCGVSTYRGVSDEQNTFDRAGEEYTLIYTHSSLSMQGVAHLEWCSFPFIR